MGHLQPGSCGIRICMYAFLTLDTGFPIFSLQRPGRHSPTARSPRVAGRGSWIDHTAQDETGLSMAARLALEVSG